MVPEFSALSSLHHPRKQHYSQGWCFVFSNWVTGTAGGYDDLSVGPSVGPKLTRGFRSRLRYPSYRDAPQLSLLNILKHL